MATSDTGHGRLEHLPALDGLRGVAVIAVVAFHAGLQGAPGGFLGVSVFFTLSGFLITRLLVAEWTTTGGIRLPTFWSRRIRRLVPAAVLTVVLVMVASRTGLLPTNDTLRGDAVASLLDVANWRFLLTGRSYAALFQTPSPLQHFWSLAIEEQFYLVYPVLLVAIMAVSKPAHLRRWLVGLLVTTSAASVVFGRGSATAGYYATILRAPELLAGAVLATVPLRDLGRWMNRFVALLAIVALGVLSTLVVVTTRTDRWLTSGGFSLVAMASCAIVAGCIAAGPVRAILAAQPLRAIGQISYGLYLYHWPVFVWLTGARTGLSFWPLLAVRIAVSVALAVVSFFFVERPIRRGAGHWQVPGAGLALAAVVVATIVVPFPAGASTAADLKAAQQALNVVPTTTTTVPAVASAAGATTSPTTAPRRPISVGIFGDSTALVTGLGLKDWADDNGELNVTSNGGAYLGCPIARAGIVDYLGNAGPNPCGNWDIRWALVLAINRIDVAVVQSGPWDVANRRLPGDDRFRGPGDPVMDAYLLGELDAAMKFFADYHVPVAWLTSPHVDLSRQLASPPPEPIPGEDPARMDRFNDLVRQAAEKYPDYVTVIDLEGYLESLPGGEMDPAIRPDGVHFERASAKFVANWLGPLVENVANGR